MGVGHRGSLAIALQNIAASISYRCIQAAIHETERKNDDSGPDRLL